MTTDNKQCQYTFSKTDYTCPHPVVTQPSSEQYCIFHLPKFTDEEQNKLQQDERTKIQQQEKDFSKQFNKLLHQVAYDDAKKEFNFLGFQFPSIDIDFEFKKGYFLTKPSSQGKLLLEVAYSNEELISEGLALKTQ
jgi:hypothetical protein